MTLRERLRPGRLGGVSRISALIWGLFCLGIALFILALPTVVALGLVDSAKPAGELAAVVIFGEVLVVPVGWASMRVFTTGVRIGESWTEIYGYGRTKSVPTAQIKEFGVTDGGVWGFLEKTDGERVNLIGVNLLGPGRFRKDRCVRRLNTALEDIRASDPRG